MDKKEKNERSVLKSLKQVINFSLKVQFFSTTIFNFVIIQMIKYHISKPSCKFEQETLRTNELVYKESSPRYLNNEYNLCDVPATVFIADLLISSKGFLCEFT